MLFMVLGAYPPERRDAIIARFTEKGSDLPEGIKPIGAWYATGKAFEVVETDSSLLIGRWLQKWNDLIAFEVIPVSDAEEVAQILAP